MIKNLETAREFHAALLSISKQLNEALTEVVPKLDVDDRHSCCMAVGRILTEVLLEGLNPLHAEHPDLKPEEMD